MVPPRRCGFSLSCLQVFPLISRNQPEEELPSEPCEASILHFRPNDQQVVPLSGKCQICFVASSPVISCKPFVQLPRFGSKFFLARRQKPMRSPSEHPNPHYSFQNGWCTENPKMGPLNNPIPTIGSKTGGAPKNPTPQPCVAQLASAAGGCQLGAKDVFAHTSLRACEASTKP